MFRTVLAVVVGILGFSAVAAKVANALRKPFHAELEKRETERHVEVWRDMQKALPVIDIYVRFLAREDTLHTLARSREGVANAIERAGLDGAYAVEVAPAFELVRHADGDVTLSFIGGSVVHTWYADELLDEWESNGGMRL